MIQHLRRAALLAIAVTIAFAAAARDEQSFTAKVMFRQGYRYFNPSFADNRAVMDGFIEHVREALADGEIDKIVVYGYASPDGMNKANERLARNRCESVIKLIIERSGVSPDLIESTPEGVAWNELRRLVEETPDVPSRDRILSILDNTPLWIFDKSGRIVGGRKKQLMDLAGGRPYNWMYAHLFPQLRNAVAVTLYLKPDNAGHDAEPVAVDSVDVADAAANSAADSAAMVVDTTEYVPMTAIIPEDTDYYNVSTQEKTATISEPIAPRQPRNYYFALKTNMLYDAVLIPNIGAEFYLGKNISLCGEWAYAWWDSDNRHRYWRYYGGNLGLRWWFGKKAHAKPLTGHHVGIYGGALTFDFEFGNRGYLGGKPGGTLWERCIVNTGIEYGFSLPVAKRINIDFSIALGYLGGNYIKYFPFDNDYYREKEIKLNYFGPTKAEISLVWLIGRGNTNNRKGGDR